MLVLVTYDIASKDANGRRQLQLVAKTCGVYGKRVQNSVFECSIDARQMREMQARLGGLIDGTTDSLRFYLLGNHGFDKTICLGQAKPAFQPFLMV